MRLKDLLGVLPFSAAPRLLQTVEHAYNGAKDAVGGLAGKLIDAIDGLVHTIQGVNQQAIANLVRLAGLSPDEA